MSILPTRRRLSLLILLASTPAMAGEAATGLDPLGQAQGDGDPPSARAGHVDHLRLSR